MLISLADFNEKQIHALDRLQEFMENNAYDAPRFFGLFGCAGSGKSTVLSYLGHTSAAHQNKIVMAAPTHKAVDVLRRMRDKRSALRDFRTIHSLLKIQKWEDAKTGEEVFETRSPIEDMDILNYDVVIVDECSMVSAYIANLLEETTKYGRHKVVYVGDPLQLPPVHEESMNGGKSLSFNTKPRMVLTYNERNAGIVNKITRAAQLMIAKDKRVPVPTTESSGRFQSEEELLAKFLEVLAEPGVQKAMDARILAFRNKTVDWWNARVREHLHGKNPEHFMPGDWMIVEAGSFLPTAMELTIDSAREVRHPRWGIKCYEIRCSQLDGKIYSVTEDQSKPYLRTKTSLQREYKMRQRKKLSYYKERQTFKEFEREFVDLKHCYAMTIHKSQGSTYKYAFVNDSPLRVALRARHELKYRGRMLYVAFSRASHGIYAL